MITRTNMARTNFQIKVSSYVGDGTDNRNITGVGFRPQMVIVKGGANIAFWRVTQNRGDSSMYFAGNTANATDCIQEILNDGFQVGTDAKVNANGTTYYYIAFSGSAGQNYFRTGRYYGTGGDDRNFTGGGLGFTPDIFWIKGDRADNPSVRTVEMVGDLSWHFSGTIDAANEIQNLQSNGVQLGTSSRVNTNTSEYFFTSFKKLTGVITCGTYTGDGVLDRQITGLGFQPDFVIVKDGTTTSAAIMRTSDFTSGQSASVGGAAPTTNQIKTFISDGFTVGTSGTVNGVGDTYWWIAYKSGSYNAPIVRTIA